MTRFADGGVPLARETATHMVSRLPQPLHARTVELIHSMLPAPPSRAAGHRDFP